MYIDFPTWERPTITSKEFKKYRKAIVSFGRCDWFRIIAKRRTRKPSVHWLLIPKLSGDWVVREASEVPFKPGQVIIYVPTVTYSQWHSESLDEMFDIERKELIEKMVTQLERMVEGETKGYFGQRSVESREVDQNSQSLGSQPNNDGFLVGCIKRSVRFLGRLLAYKG